MAIILSRDLHPKEKKISIYTFNINPPKINYIYSKYYT